MYFMNDYLNDLYLEKIAKKSDVKKKELLGIPYNARTVKGYLGDEEHVVYPKHIKKKNEEWRPKAYAGMVGAGYGYLGARAGKRVLDEFSSGKGRYADFMRKNKAARFSTVAAPAALFGVQGLRQGHHIGKALNAYVDKTDVNDL